MSSERVITIQLNGTSGGPGGPALNAIAVFQDEPVRLELDPPPPPGTTPSLTPDPEQEGVGFTWEQSTLTASTAGMARIRCSWPGQGISFVGLIWLVVLPASARPLAGAGAVRHLLVRGPDRNFYLFSPGQTQWPTVPFMPESQGGIFEKSGQWGGGAIMLSDTAGITGVLYNVVFKTADGTAHAFFIINLSSILRMLSDSHRDYEFRSLLLGGPDHQGYLIPWSPQTGHTLEWPQAPAHMTSNPFISRGNGASNERFIHAKIHDDTLGDVLMYDLAEMLYSLNRQAPPRLVASLYTRSPENGAYSYRFFQIDAAGITAMEDIQQDELRDYQGGRLRSGVLCTRVSTDTRDTYLYNINAYADAAEGWVETHDKNELLFRTPGFETGSGAYYYFFSRTEKDDDWGDSVARHGLDMEKYRLEPGQVPYSIQTAVRYSVATGNILLDHFNEPALTANAGSEFISCYLLNFNSLLPR